MRRFCPTRPTYPPVNTDSVFHDLDTLELARVASARVSISGLSRGPDTLQTLQYGVQTTSELWDLANTLHDMACVSDLAFWPFGGDMSHTAPMPNGRATERSLKTVLSLPLPHGTLYLEVLVGRATTASEGEGKNLCHSNL